MGAGAASLSVVQILRGRSYYGRIANGFMHSFRGKETVPDESLSVKLSTEPIRQFSGSRPGHVDMLSCSGPRPFCLLCVSWLSSADLGLGAVALNTVAESHQQSCS